MDNKNQPAYPVSEEVTERIDQDIKIYTGLTKREWLAATLDISKDLTDLPFGMVQKLIGRPMPTDQIEAINYWAEIDAKLRVIKADALLKELSK